MDNDAVQTKLIQLEYMNQQIRALESHLAEVVKAVEELGILKVGLENIGESKKGDEVLVPLGASAYVPANLVSSDRVVVSIGAGIFVDKKVEDAVPIVALQMNELRSQEEMVIQNLSALSKEAERMTGEINASLQADKDVRIS